MWAARQAARTLSQAARPIGAAATAVAAGAVASCNEDHIGAQELHWSNHGALAALDAKSVRRGFQVYKEVCASCHSVERLAFRNLVEYGAWSEEEVKAMAEALHPEVENDPRQSRAGPRRARAAGRVGLPRGALLRQPRRGARRPRRRPALRRLPPLLRHRGPRRSPCPNPAATESPTMISAQRRNAGRPRAHLSPPRKSGMGLVPVAG